MASRSSLAHLEPYEEAGDASVKSKDKTLAGAQPKKLKKLFALPSLKKAQRKLWRRFREDPVLWIESCIKLINKETREAPFLLNKIQRRYWEILKKLYWKPYQLPSGKWVHRLQGVREVNLKARQFGLSSFICALLLHDTVFFSGTKNWLFCQGEEESKTMLEDKVKYYFHSIDLEDELIVLPKPGQNNTKALGFPEISSRFSCRGPGQDARTSRKRGRSMTVRGALMSEVQDWENAEDLMQGIEPALNDPSTNFFVEFSPKLHGDYGHTFYQLAKKGEGGWQARFWPWFLHHEYELPIYSEEERAELEASLTHEEIKFIEYVRLEWMEDITLEQIKWRRNKKASPALQAKGPQAFRQEYPENDKDCFEALGAQIFRDERFEIKVCTTREREAKPGRMHVIFADVSDGTGADDSFITVVDVLTREQIYKWRSNHVDSTRLHLELYQVWLRYPGVVGIETNGIGRATIAMARSDKTLVKDENGIERPLCEIWEDFVHCGHQTYDGLPTLSEKPTEIHLLRASIAEAVDYYGPLTTDSEIDTDSPGRGIRISSEDIIEQMPNFQSLGGGKMGAKSPLKDDGIMSLLGAHRLLREAGDYQRVFNKRFSQFKQQTEEAAA